jgi:hypothetical protein
LPENPFARPRPRRQESYRSQQLRKSTGKQPRWSTEEEEKLRECVNSDSPSMSATIGNGAWGRIATALNTGRTGAGVSQHWMIMNGTRKVPRKSPPSTRSDTATPSAESAASQEEDESDERDGPSPTRLSSGGRTLSSGPSPTNDGISPQPPVVNKRSPGGGRLPPAGTGSDEENATQDAGRLRDERQKRCAKCRQSFAQLQVQYSVQCTGARCNGAAGAAPRFLCLGCVPAHDAGCGGWVACDVCRGIRLCPLCVDTVEMVLCDCCAERQKAGRGPDRGRASYGMACASCVFPGWRCEACDY